MTLATADHDLILLAARRRRALRIAVGSLLAVTALMAALAAVYNHGVFTYVVDDPYIHVAMARNLAQHATYGVVPGVYQSASSSPGWVALLASIIKVAPGTALWLPLGLNLAAGAGILVLILRSQTVLLTLESTLVRDVLAALLPVALFLPGLAMVGMEHSLHALLIVALFLLLDRALRGSLTRPELGGFVALWGLAAAVRYETLFLSAGAALALLVVPTAPGAEAGIGALRILGRRMRRPELWAALLPAAAVTLLLGAINLAHGEFFLPNSVVAKAQLGFGGWAASLMPSAAESFNRLIGDPMAAVLFATGVAYLAVRRLRGVQSGLWLAWLVLVALHVTYARFGWYERYQAYLLITGVLLALRSLPELRLPERRLAVVVPLAALLALLPAAKFHFEAQAPEVSHVVYRYQYETARFLARAYDGQAVMAGDIGLVAYEHRGTLDDILGLGSYEVLAAMRKGEETPAFMADLARRDGVAVAVMYHGDSLKLAPGGWVRVASWAMFGSSAQDEALSDLDFWAPTPKLAGELRAKMAAFAAQLPNDTVLRLVAASA